MATTDGAVSLGRAAGIFARAWRVLTRGQRVRLGVVAAVTMVAGLTVNVPALVVGALVDSVASKGPIGAETWVLLGVLVASIVVLALTRAFVHVEVHAITPPIEAQYRTRALDKSLRVPFDDEPGEHSGSVNSRMSRGAEGVAQLVRLVFGDLVPTMVTCAWALILAFRQNWIIAAVIGVVLPVGLLIVRRQIRAESGVRLDLEHRRATLDGSMTELLSGRQVVRSLDATDQEVHRVEVLALANAEREARHHRHMGSWDTAKFLNENLFGAAVVAAGVVLAARGQISAGEVLTMYLLYQAASQPLRDLHRIFDEGTESLVKTSMLMTLLDQPDDEAFQPEVISLPAPSAPAIEVRGASRSFPGRDGPALDDVSMVVQPGERVGLAGPTGSGKSTLVSAILGLTRLDGGEVRIFGADLAGLDVRERARLLGYVPQRPYFVAGTVWDNLVFGHPEAGRLAVADVVAACESAAVADVIEALPSGYDTPLGEGGWGLSGGQLQRLALARVLLRRPQVLILDEATSALDAIREERVMASVMGSGLTVITVAHRLSTLHGCDRIHVMADGRIIETGTYSELAGAGGLFATMLDASHTEDPRLPSIEREAA